MNEVVNPEKIGGNTEAYQEYPGGKFKKDNPGKPFGAKTKKPLKSFSLQEFNSWDDEKKRDFLEKISPFDRWRMTEGNPDTETKHEGELRVQILPGEEIERNEIQIPCEPISDSEGQDEI